MDQSTNSYFEVDAQIRLYESSIGRKSHIKTGYRPHVFFGISDPTNPNFASDCILSLLGQNELNPGEQGLVKLLILRYKHLDHLLDKGVKIKLKEGNRLVGDGILVKIYGERYVK